MKLHVVALIAIGLICCGCARDVAITSAPNLNVYTSYTAKVPGKWALFVTADPLRKTVRPDGTACAAYNWPVDLSGAFRQSAAATFRNLVEEVDLIDQPVAAETLTAGGYSGIIRINGDDIRTHMSVAQSFFSSTIEVAAEIDTGLLVDGRSGRLLGTQTTGLGRGENDVGLLCDGAAAAIEISAQAAMKTALGQLAERFSNAPQLRAGFVAPAPGPQSATLSQPTSVTTGPITRKLNLEMTTSTLTRDNLVAARMPDPYGAVVVSVWPRGVADRAGIKSGDVIQTFNGHRVSGMEELNDYLSELAPGAGVNLGVWRNRQVVVIPITQ